MTDFSTTDPRLMRASDQDRELAVEDLREACLVGRLTVDEYAIREEAALNARTLGDLWTLTRDIVRAGSPYAPVAPAPMPTPMPMAMPMPMSTPLSPTPMWGQANYFPPNPWAYPAPVVAPKPRVHSLAVVAFTVSLVGLLMANAFVGSILGAALGGLALRQVGNSKDRTGHNLATAAVAISLASILLGLYLVFNGIR